MALVSKTFELYGKTYTFEAGELAKQATGAALIKQGDTTVLLTAVVSKERKNYDFFPLTVDFNEKMYAAGRIPGGYLKREGRPSEKATLTARMIDRPLRPSFPDGFRNEVQVVATSLVADQSNPCDVICVMGASLALSLGGVPFEGPLACVRIGRNRETGEFLVNPTYEERENSDLDLELGGTRDFISMVEAGAEEVTEEDMLAAMQFGQEALGAFCDAQLQFIEEYERVNGPIVKKEYPLDEPVAEVHDRIFAHYDEMAAALCDADKLSRMAKVDAVKQAIVAEFTEEEQVEWEREIPVNLKKLEKQAMRTMVVETGERVDGRAADEIRPIMVKDNYLPLVHGSGLFQRGQTQVLSVLSLGMLNEGQRLDTIEPVEGKRYMHHYNFPPFCTGETGRIGSPKRREIGHGNLAERALLPVLPDENEFPYAIRVVSEVMESNGSSSMASTCGSCLALMDGGVPLKRPVSGIAMGLIQEEGKTVVLSDIQGIEDFLGDMDFKVTGTERGITALQMDNKATGLTFDILRRALEQAKEGRAFILDKMLQVIPEPRHETRPTAPRIVSLQVPVDKIRDVIGSGGKVIRGIQDETGASVDIQEVPFMSAVRVIPSTPLLSVSSSSSRFPSLVRSTPVALSPSSRLAPLFLCFRAKTACFTSLVSLRAASIRLRMFSTWATRSRSVCSRLMSAARFLSIASISPRLPRALRLRMPSVASALIALRVSVVTVKADAAIALPATMARVVPRAVIMRLSR